MKSTGTGTELSEKDLNEAIEKASQTVPLTVAIAAEKMGDMIKALGINSKEELEAMTLPQMRGIAVAAVAMASHFVKNVDESEREIIFDLSKIVQGVVNGNLTSDDVIKAIQGAKENLKAEAKDGKFASPKEDKILDKMVGFVRSFKAKA